MPCNKIPINHKWFTDFIKLHNDVHFDAADEMTNSYIFKANMLSFLSNCNVMR